METKGTEHLHDNVPDSALSALLVDVLNDFDFPQNECLLSFGADTRPAAELDLQMLTESPRK